MHRKPGRLHRPALGLGVAAAIAFPLALRAVDDVHLVRDIDTTGEPYVIPGGCPPGIGGFCPPSYPIFGGAPAQLQRLAGTLYFAADDHVHGAELWASDGTAAGTRLVADVCPGPCDSSPRLVTEAGGALLFWADDGRHGTELWRTDGSAAGTALLADVCPGACSGNELDPTGWLAHDGLPWGGLGGSVFFEARPRPGNRQRPGSELWASDGTPAGTRKVFDFCPGGPCGDPIPALVFGPPSPPLLVGRRGTVSDLSGLWRITGTTTAPELLSDTVVPVRPMAALGGTVVFAGLVLDDPVRGAVFASDGTAGGTRPIWEGPGGPELPVRLGDAVYWVAVDGARVSFWRTDGTPAGTRKAFDGPPGLAGLVEVVPFGGELYFQGLDAATYRFSLWRTENGVSGAAGLGAGVGTLASFRVARDRLYFVGSDEAHGDEPWVSDGTAAGTRLLRDVAPGDSSSLATLGPAVAGLGPVLGGRLFFRADDGVHGRELWAIRLPFDGGPPPPDAPPITSAEFPGFRFWVRIDSPGSPPRIGARAASCLPETVCVTGALPGRIEVFLRIVGPKPNGRLWPTIVKLSTAEVEVWIEQTATGALRYYDLPGATPGSSELPGLFDREGFAPL